MTYCLGIRLNEGLVFLSDSRTNAGVDHVNTFCKMKVWNRPGERVLVLLSSGNLSTTQAVVNILEQDNVADAPHSLFQAPNMFTAVSRVGDALRTVFQRDAESLKNFNVEFNASFIFGGQIAGDSPRLFTVYSAGNFIEATDHTPFFQIGELKYGKPILDRVISAHSTLDQAIKCALISMDSTLRSNLSVGLPLDLLSYRRDSLKVDYYRNIDESDPYYSMIHQRWGEQLRRVFAEIPNPNWGM